MTMPEILTIIIALTSLVVAYLAYYNNSIADVVIYAEVNKERPSIINLVIHNIGKGIAQDIKIQSSQPIPKNAFGIAKLHEPKEIFESGIFLSGIPILFPNEKLIFDWGQYGGLLESLEHKPLNISISYYSKTNLQIFKRKLTNHTTIDLSIYENTSIGESVFQRDIRNSLKSIARSLEKISKFK